MRVCTFHFMFASAIREKTYWYEVSNVFFLNLTTEAGKVPIRIYFTLPRLNTIPHQANGKASINMPSVNTPIFMTTIQEFTCEYNKTCFNCFSNMSRGSDQV